MASNNKPIIKQFRYFGVGHSNNVPEDEVLWIGGVVNTTTSEKKNLLSNYGSAIKVGIQGLPGTIFYLNNSTPRGIVIDHTGVYELDLRNTTTTIDTLYFDPTSLQNISKIDNASLIIDILYYPREGAVN